MLDFDHVLKMGSFNELRVCLMEERDLVGRETFYWHLTEAPVAGSFSKGRAVSRKPTNGTSPPPEPNPPGRPEYEPTDFDKGRVQAFTVAGYGQEDIATRLGISTPTLRKHYREQLDFAKMDFLASVTQSLGIQAVGAPAVYDEHGHKLREEVARQPGPCYFILKTQGKKLGWSERLGAGGPLNPEDVDWSQYTDQEIELIANAQQLLTRAAAPAPAGIVGATAKAH